MPDVEVAQVHAIIDTATACFFKTNPLVHAKARSSPWQVMCMIQTKHVYSMAKWIIRPQVEMELTSSVIYGCQNASQRP